MKRKSWFLITAACALCLLSIILFAEEKPPALQNNMEEIIANVENAIGEDYQKQFSTKVYNLLYSNAEGSDIVYYICLTTYYNADPSNFTGLNSDAIGSVINLKTAENQQACQVSGFPAVLCSKSEKAYLCWTINPEISCILEYDPEAVSKGDIFRMAESAPVNTDN